MTRWFSRFGSLLVLLATLGLAGLAHAQQGDVSATADNGQATQQSDDAEPAAASAADQDEAAEEEDNADDAPVGDSPIRFIPTEQVSQDLGVSFPADI